MLKKTCNRTGFAFSAISLGFWHNFGANREAKNATDIVSHALDMGIFSLDLANNYGPPPGAAEKFLGSIIGKLPRHELSISTKAGFHMWPGEFGQGGSRKHLFESINQSLERLNLDYVDIFYHHVPDSKIDLEETVAALSEIVRSGKAIYYGLSNYSAHALNHVCEIAMRGGHPLPIAVQNRHNLLRSDLTSELMETADRWRVNAIGYAPLAQGLLSKKYLGKIPDGSRASRNTWDQGDLKAEDVRNVNMQLIEQLATLANSRGQSLPQMAIAWCLRNYLYEESRMVSQCVGFSSPFQIDEIAPDGLKTKFLEGELGEIAEIASTIEFWK